jgi:hypothetical protein
MSMKSPTTFPIVRRDDGWWIEPTDAVANERIGPYQTLRAAEQDRCGVIRFLRRVDAGRNPFE